jgi:chromosome segregation ATPase
MTKFSKPLTVFVTLMCVTFMAVTWVMTIARTDWKAELEKYPASVRSEQSARITELDEQIKTVEERTNAAQAAIGVDISAMTARDARWVAELKQKLDAAHELAVRVEQQAKLVQAKLDEGKLRREEVVRLMNQYEELVAQKEAAQAEARRLRDLLFQSTGTLERVQRRQELLENEANGPNYDGDKTAAGAG